MPSCIGSIKAGSVLLTFQWRGSVAFLGCRSIRSFSQPDRAYESAEPCGCPGYELMCGLKRELPCPAWRPASLHVRRHLKAARQTKQLTSHPKHRKPARRQRAEMPIDSHMLPRHQRNPSARRSLAHTSHGIADSDEAARRKNGRSIFSARCFRISARAGRRYR